MRLLTNPGSNLPPDLLQRYGVFLLPQRIVVDGDSHDTRTDIRHADVDRWVREAQRWPRTIGTTAAETVSGFQEAAEAGARELLVVTTSRKVINSHQAAELAVETFGATAAGKGVRIHVVDTGVTDVGAALACVLAGEAIRAGRPFEDVVGMVQRACAATRMAVSLATLDNMVKGGRVSSVRAFMADVLSVRPLLAFVDGALEAVAKVSTKRGDPVMSMVEWLRGQVTPGRRVWLGLMHAGDSAPLERVRAEVGRHWDVAAVMTRPLAPGVYLHTGPGAFSACLLPVDQLGWTPPVPPLQ